MTGFSFPPADQARVAGLGLSQSKRRRNVATAALLLFMMAGAARADEEELREFSTDRPDKTESPFTVPKNHIQAETELASFTRHRTSSGDENTIERTFGAGSTNLKYGIADDIDVQLILGGYVNQSTLDLGAGVTDRAHGYGDTTLRAKLNFWGNDGGETALGLIPFVKLPTASRVLGNGAVEGGVVLPFSWKFAEGWDFGTELEVDALRRDVGPGYAANFVQSATIARELMPAIEVYAELWSSRSAENGSRTMVTFDTGLTFGLGENTQFDLGVNIGLNQASDTVNPFIGMSWRF